MTYLEIKVNLKRTIKANLKCLCFTETVEKRRPAIPVIYAAERVLRYFALGVWDEAELERLEVLEAVVLAGPLEAQRS